MIKEIKKSKERKRFKDLDFSIKFSIETKNIVSYEVAKRIIAREKYIHPELKLSTPEEYSIWRNSLGRMKDILPENPQQYYSIYK